MLNIQEIPQWLQDLPSHHNIILFDGICAVCNTFINFVIDNDPQRIYKFAALQSDIGVQLKQLHNIDPALDSMILIDQRTDNNKLGMHHIRSTAAIRIIATTHTWFSIFLYVPELVRDFGYATFASVRYRIFGYVDKCRRPTADVKQRFLESSTLSSENDKKVK